MPTTIRTSTFETNSSSAHALCAMSPEQFNAFQHGEYFLHFEASRDRDLLNPPWVDVYTDGAIEVMTPRAVGFSAMPLENAYTLVPVDQVDDYVAENLDEWDKEYFYEPSYEGEQPYWWSHQNASLMSYEDMTKSTWHDKEWPQVDVLDDRYVRVYYSFEV